MPLMVMWCDAKRELTRRKSNVKYNPKRDGELEQMNRGKWSSILYMMGCIAMTRPSNYEDASAKEICSRTQQKEQWQR